MGRKVVMIGFDPAHRDTNGKVRITEREPAWASEPVDRRFVKKYDDDDDHGARRMFGGFTLEYLLEVDHIGEPIPLMVGRVKKWLAEGRTVKIFAARVHGHGQWLVKEGSSAAKDRHEFLMRNLTGDMQEGVGEALREINSIEKEFTVDAITPIKEWCLKHIGQKLEVTNVKDFGMIELWDDRAVQVIPNTGRRADTPRPCHISSPA